MVILVTNTLDWLREMLSVNRKSHVIRYVLTLRIFGAPKKLRFRQNHEEVFNRLNSTNWVKLHKGHLQGSLSEVMCRGHVQGSRAGGIRVARSDLHLQMGGVPQCRLKRKCQLVVRLKADKCYQELLCSLSSYINLLNLLNLQGLHSWLLAPGRFQTSSPWSKPLTNSDLKGGACTCAHV